MNIKTNKKVIILGFIVFVLIIWVILNPIGKFGFHFFGFTVYSAIPFPYFDLKIHANGLPSIREKSHFVSLEEVSDLIDDNPEALIIGIGYDELVKVDERISNSTIKIETLETSRAIERFNELKDDNERVVAIIHSTC